MPYHNGSILRMSPSSSSTKLCSVRKRLRRPLLFPSVRFGIGSLHHSTVLGLPVLLSSSCCCCRCTVGFFSAGYGDNRCFTIIVSSPFLHPRYFIPIIAPAREAVLVCSYVIFVPVMSRSKRPHGKDLRRRLYVQIRLPARPHGKLFSYTST